jgi:hypothetical protein
LQNNNDTTQERINISHGQLADPHEPHVHIITGLLKLFSAGQGLIIVLFFYTLGPLFSALAVADPATLP